MEPGKKYAVLIIPLLFLIMPRCSLLLPGIDVEIELPAAAWEAEGLAVPHVLVYPDTDGSIQKRSLAAGVRRTIITLPRNCCVPVAAYPFGRLKPAGAFLGPDLNRDAWTGMVRLKLDYRRGALVELILGILKMEDRCRTVNFECLNTAMLKKGKGDPWGCDLERIRHSILTGTLNYLQVRGLPEYTAEVTLPSGDWIAEPALFRGKIESSERLSDDRWLVVFSELYTGCARFYSPDTNMELHLYIDKKGGCRWIIGSPADFSRRL